MNNVSWPIQNRILVPLYRSVKLEVFKTEVL